MQKGKSEKDWDPIAFQEFAEAANLYTEKKKKKNRGQKRKVWWANRQEQRKQDTAPPPPPQEATPPSPPQDDAPPPGSLALVRPTGMPNHRDCNYFPPWHELRSNVPRGLSIWVPEEAIATLGPEILRHLRLGGQGSGSSSSSSSRAHRPIQILDDEEEEEIVFPKRARLF